MPSIDGMLSSIGPADCGPGLAPSSNDRLYAKAASLTRNAIAQMDPPCSCAKRCAKLPDSALIIKLMSPWRCSVTFRERWRATAGNPIWLNNDRSSVGSGAVYSTNSNPSVPIGLPDIVIYLSPAVCSLRSYRMILLESACQVGQAACKVAHKITPVGNWSAYI